MHLHRRRDGGPPRRGDAAERYFSEYAGLWGLTPQQRLEDYDYLWDSLESGFVDLGIAERSGIGLAAVREQGRARIQEIDSDFALAFTLNNTVSAQLGGIGHLSVLDPPMREMLAALYQTEDGSLAPYVDALTNPLSEKNYGLFAGPYEALMSEWSALAPEASSDGQERRSANLTTDIIQGSAYLKTGAMLTDPEEEREAVLRFYERAKYCDNLIIDISENSGGNIAYWQELLVAPNITEPLSYGAWLLACDSENNRPFLDLFGGELGLRPARELPALPRLAKEDRARADFYTRFGLTIRPAGEKKAFGGKIWVLTGPAVYSASEQFAAFCKQTGFATLVGSRTGGDGFGMDPIYCVLPNSGLIVRYSLFAGLNPDGTNNEEYGTSPDITKKTSETALDACLRAIANGR